MEIKLYDKVLLKDKREGIIIEIYKHENVYLCKNNKIIIIYNRDF